MSSSVSGTVADGFEEVRAEFATVVAEEPGGAGAQLAAYLDGRRVVDLWAGDAITGDSLTGVFSTTKGALHLVVALLAQERELDLDRAVAGYWPRFASDGKGELTVRELLTHRSGLIGVDGGFTTAELADDRQIADRLAGQRPFWQPGTAYGYHAYVIGALVGEVVRRGTGLSIQELYEQRVRAPLGLDLYLGMPKALESRYIDVQPMRLTTQQQAERAANAPSPSSLTGIAFNLQATPPTDLVQFANTRAVRAAGQSSAGGVGSARGVAAMYAAAISGLDGGRALLEPGTLAQFGKLHTLGTDLVTSERDHFALGFEATGVRYRFLGRDAFGHAGATGSQSFADPQSGVAYSYVRRRFIFGGGGGSPENERLAAAVLRAARARSQA